MQGVLLQEAFRLVEDGVCDAADVDTAIADGIGLRWAFMGAVRDHRSQRTKRGARLLRAAGADVLRF